MLPLQSEISINDFKFQTIWFFLAIALLVYLFTLWNEANKDGFDLYKVYDFILSSLVLQVGLFFLINFALDKLQFYTNFFVLHDVEPLVFLSSIMFVCQYFLTVFFSKKSKWSLYRLLDLTIVSFLYSLLIVLVGEYVLTLSNIFIYLFVAVLILAVVGSLFRNSHIMSGFVFSGILLLLVLASYPYLINAFYLPIQLTLITISLLTIYFRRKIGVQTRNLRHAQIMILKTGLLNSLKQKLLSKEKKLKKENELLVSEDPYLKQGRSEDNAETIDDAILEDMVKESVDNNMNVVSKAMMGVRRALARIKLGKYGVCDVCGNKIENARLRAYPEATTCVTCAQKNDK